MYEHCVSYRTKGTMNDVMFKGPKSSQQLEFNALFLAGLKLLRQGKARHICLYSTIYTQIKQFKINLTNQSKQLNQLPSTIIYRKTAVYNSVSPQNFKEFVQQLWNTEAESSFTQLVSHIGDTEWICP